ncbi:MAG: hypothetical protein PUP91_09885 [Rhizonema sp. PD37]|nr:hypothetical protein [Rhizonema sp. PD37]
MSYMESGIGANGETEKAGGETSAALRVSRSRHQALAISLVFSLGETQSCERASAIFSQRETQGRTTEERRNERQGLARSHGDCNLRSNLPCLLTRGDPRAKERQGNSPVQESGEHFCDFLIP